MRKRPGREAGAVAADQVGRRGRARPERPRHPGREAALGGEPPHHRGDREGERRGVAVEPLGCGVKTKSRRRRTVASARPREAGTQGQEERKNWIPACAGMSGVRGRRNHAPHSPGRKSCARSRHAAKAAPSPPSSRRSLRRCSDKPPDGADWVHEVKFDGYRMQARLEDGKVKLLTRKALDWTHKFKPVADAVAQLDADTALIDGEIVVETERRQRFLGAAGCAQDQQVELRLLRVRPAASRRRRLARQAADRTQGRAGRPAQEHRPQRHRALQRAFRDDRIARCSTTPARWPRRRDLETARCALSLRPQRRLDQVEVPREPGIRRSSATRMPRT